ncbi:MULTISPECIES: hypothetical protein [Planktothricoides]|uniref:Uncharacterized protein n=2 Tax=Planktothricoides raciborskii TaxID=132608 RepID=A0AAU8J7T5_9CYAN|nr:MULTISPECIES: hypothetical protein [Planktothricoides]MBD2545580.1 hypothetical protein [Planktothricoides raciborskii FACHB-1370]MBD2583486.1 hypothetical protein [Planktothricoides raciborskii FACHB-1261]
MAIRPYNILSNQLSAGMLRPYRNASPLPECFALTGMLRPYRNASPYRGSVIGKPL